MSQSQNITDFCWYAVQTLSNKEHKAKQYLDKFIHVEEMGDYVKEVLMPTEKVTEVKNSKKTTKSRKLYPGYLFIQMRLYDEHRKMNQAVWHFIKGTQGIIGFPGGDNPVPLRQPEIDRILNQLKEAEGKAVPKTQYEIGQSVKITDGPFMNLTGVIDEVDPERGRLKVSVSIFGRFTPVDLEYWQVEKNED